MKITVDCYSGYKVDERPTHIRIGSKKIAVRKIIRQWISPDYRYFTIKGDDGNNYTICYDVLSWEWILQS